MTFTISQTPDGVNLYIYPSASSVTMFTPVGVSQNYNCVNETWESPNDDTDYVYWTGISKASDSYTMQNHTTESGTINYVRVITDAKSNLYTQSSSGIYKLFVNDGMSTVSGNNHAPLPISYMKYYDTFGTKPSGGAWTWTGIDNLKCGVVCSSPIAMGTPINLILRPSAAGDNNDWNRFLSGVDQGAGNATNYTYVDEVIADGSNTYVGTQNIKQDLYNIENHTTQIGTINSVTVFFCAASSAYGIQMCCSIKNGATITDGTTRYINVPDWVDYSDTWVTNPATGIAWTWANIDALQVGCKRLNSSSGFAKVTQIYVVVNHLGNVNPEIRTTQCYAVVNYTPTTSTVSLSIPETLNVTHSRDINRITFPDGVYAVDDYGRQGKALSISGQEVTNAFAKMQTLKNMCHYGKNITIAGLPDNNLNTDYMIVNFNFNQESGEMNRYHWTLELEEA